MRKVFSNAYWRQIALSGPLFLLLCLVAMFNSRARSAAPVQARSKSPAPAVSAVDESGTASYYGFKYQGRPTASGEIFDLNQFTAAHKTLPFGTRVKVTNLANSRSVTVRINDRGPFIAGRIIDLSEAAAHELEMIQSGTAAVKLEILR